MNDEIKTVLANVLGVSPGQIADNASIDDWEAWDSLRQIRLLMALEDRFRVTFTDEEIGDLTSIPAIAGALEHHKAGR